MFTLKILLNSENYNISNPLIFIMLGKIYLNQHTLIKQSVGSFSFSSKVTGLIYNTYNKYLNLPLISKNVSKHNSNLTDSNFGYFLAGLIEGDGWFGKNNYTLFFQKKIFLWHTLLKNDFVWVESLRTRNTFFKIFIFSFKSFKKTRVFSPNGSWVASV